MDRPERQLTAGAEVVRRRTLEAPAEVLVAAGTEVAPEHIVAQGRREGEIRVVDVAAGLRVGRREAKRHVVVEEGQWLAAGTIVAQRRVLLGEARAVWARKPSPFRLPNLHYTASTGESMGINAIAGGAIVIAGSGMANGGRIQHHLRHRLARRDTHVVFVGYQAEGTLGRRLVERAPWVRIHGRDHRVNAQIHTVGGLSAHTGQSGLIDWYEGFEGRPPLVLVHGEDRAREALAGEIGERFGARVDLARPGMRLVV